MDTDSIQSAFDAECARIAARRALEAMDSVADYHSKIDGGIETSVARDPSTGEIVMRASSRGGVGEMFDRHGDRWEPTYTWVTSPVTMEGRVAPTASSREFRREAVRISDRITEANNAQRMATRSDRMK